MADDDKELGHFTHGDAKKIARHVQRFGDRAPALNRRARRRPAAPSARIDYWVQGPADGIDAGTSSGVPGSAPCDVLVEATVASAGIVVGQLVKNGSQITIRNYYEQKAGPTGNNKIRVSGHFDNAQVINWDCSASGQRTDIKTLP